MVSVVVSGAIIGAVEAIKKVIPGISGITTIAVAVILGVLAGIAGVDGLDWFTGLITGLVSVGGVTVATKIAGK